MKFVSYSIMIQAAILSISNPTYAGEVHTIQYSLDVSAEKIAKFTCIYATNGQCYIKTGKDDSSSSEEHAIQSGGEN
ncbi:hypothetical protein [Undibacterium sp. SXout20W]|uniref:hypothetical protein n=1 Tax=Undibacterium sp. SXout20W TaxID=3413051 RepID=UPI003BEF838B